MQDCRVNKEEKRKEIDLGDVLVLGELEGDAEAAEEDGDEGAGVAEGGEAELLLVLDDSGQLLERLRDR